MDTLAALQFGFAPALASALLHALWQDALLGVAAWLTLASMSRSSAALRHTVAMAFLLAMVLVPATMLVRVWNLAPLAAESGVLQALVAPRMETATGGSCGNPVRSRSCSHCCGWRASA